MATKKAPEKTATFVKVLDGFTGVAKLYKLSIPLSNHAETKSYRHVIVSATVAMFSGPETFIFGATSNGKVSEWEELSGSFKGDLNHDKALRNAGYTVIGDR